MSEQPNIASAGAHAALPAPAPVPAPAPLIGLPLRSARALVGFMAHNEAVTTMSMRQPGPGTPEQNACIAAAHAAVAAREPLTTSPSVDADPPADLISHVTALAATQPAGAMLAEGWQPRLVDLAGVRAAQPIVFGDADERVQGLRPHDLVGLAAVTMPLPTQHDLPVSYNPQIKAFVFASANPNLRVLGNFSGPAAPGAPGFGFVVAVTASQMQVAIVDGRPILRDGYHRAVALIARGITRIPAFVRHFDAIEEVGLPPGMLPGSLVMGHWPPLLGDYLDEVVAVDIELPATQKVVMVQAVEIETLG